MSQSIWTRCAGRSEIRRLAGRFRRVVEAQFRNSTRKLVDSDDEQRVLEELLDARAKLPVPAGFEGLHYLLYTPFRHPPLRNGSRFGTRRERGILYAGRDLATVFAEVAYYRLVFLEGTSAALGAIHVDLTAFSFGLAARRGVESLGAALPRLRGGDLLQGLLRGAAAAGRGDARRRRPGLPLRLGPRPHPRREPRRLRERLQACAPPGGGALGMHRRARAGGVPRGANARRGGVARLRARAVLGCGQAAGAGVVGR